jgi:hypothetical protein
LLCEKFWFAALLSKSRISGRRIQLSTTKHKRVCRVEEQTLQQERVLCLLQTEVSDFLAAQSRFAGDNGQLVKAKKILDGSVCLLQKEVADLREGYAREIVTLRVELTQKNRVLCEELAKCESSRQRENTEFGED